jgi:hypothetical protein
VTAEAERPNFLALGSVLTGAFAVLVHTCTCLGAVVVTFPLSGLCALVALVLGLLARRQALLTGRGADHAWWGIAIGGLLTTAHAITLGIVAVFALAEALS